MPIPVFPVGRLPDVSHLAGNSGTGLDQEITFIARLAFLPSLASGDRAGGARPPQRQALRFMFSNQLQEVCCGIIWNQGFLILLQVKRLLNWEGKCWVSYIYGAKIHFSIYWMVNVLSNYLHILNKVTGHLERSSILDKTKKDLWSGGFLIERAKGDSLWKCVPLKEIVFILLRIVLRSSILAFI